MKNIVIFCIGSKTHGMGHVVRCITLAEHLAKRDCRVEFVTLSGTPGFDRLLKTKFAVRGVGSMDDMFGPFSLLNTFHSGAVDAAILDFEHGPTPAMLNDTRELFPCVVNIGGVGWAMQDPDALDNLVDLQIYQSVLHDAPPHPRRLAGVEYMIINPAYGKCMADYDGGHVVMSFGGSDPYNLTSLALRYMPEGRRWDIVIGGAHGQLSGPVFDVDTNRLRALMHCAPPDLVGIFMGASLSLIQLGMTAYESMAAGVAPLLVNLSEDHQRTAVELERLGCAINLGLWNEFDPAAVRARVEWLLARPDELRRMGESGARLVDARGASRCADKIVEMMK